VGARGGGYRFRSGGGTGDPRAARTRDKRLFGAPGGERLGSGNGCLLLGGAPPQSRAFRGPALRGRGLAPASGPRPLAIQKEAHRRLRYPRKDHHHRLDRPPLAPVGRGLLCGGRGPRPPPGAVGGFPLVRGGSGRVRRAVPRPLPRGGRAHQRGSGPPFVLWELRAPQSEFFRLPGQGRLGSGLRR